MKETDRETIANVVAQIDEVVAQHYSPIESASTIVSDLWGRDRDIMELAQKYSELITIADIASDLEILQDDDPRAVELWSALLANFDRLKDKLAMQEG